MTWKDKVTFLDAPTGITYNVRGQDIKFYQMSPRMLLQLRTLSRPLSQALAVLFRNKSSDADVIYRDFKDPTTGESGTETSKMAMAPATLELLFDKKEKAIDQLISAVSDEVNLHLLVAIIFDSCRDLFPRTPDPDEISKFLTEPGIDIGVLMQFMFGVGKANVKTLGPLADRVSETFSQKMEEALETQGPMSSPTENEDPQSPFDLQTPG